MNPGGNLSGSCPGTFLGIYTTFVAPGGGADICPCNDVSPPVNKGWRFSMGKVCDGAYFIINPGGKVLPCGGELRILGFVSKSCGGDSGADGGTDLITKPSGISVVTMLHLSCNT